MRKEFIFNFSIYLIILVLISTINFIYVKNVYLQLSLIGFSFVQIPVCYKQRIILIFLIALTTSLLVYYLSFVLSFSLQMVMLYIIMLAAIFVAIKSSEFFIPIFMLVFIICLAHFTHSLFNPNTPFMIMLGALLVCLLQGIYREHDFEFYREKAYSILSRVTEDIFECMLNEDYPHNKYIFERRLHDDKRAFLLNLNFLQTTSKTQEEFRKMKTVTTLYWHLLNISQIRLRVTDHATFTICREELKFIKGIIIKQLKGHHTDNTKSIFQNAIERLEANYENILKVAAKEPIDFLIFIENLKKYDAAIAN